MRETAKTNRAVWAAILAGVIAAAGIAFMALQADRREPPSPGRAAMDAAEDSESGTKTFRKTGSASWYDFSGEETASGEIMDEDDMTAAHRSLPFGTKLRVENLENGKDVTVRVNDRGPYAKDRIIDVSEEAAERLDMTEDGVVDVRIKKVAPPEGRATSSPTVQQD